MKDIEQIIKEVDGTMTIEGMSLNEEIKIELGCAYLIL